MVPGVQQAELSLSLLATLGLFVYLFVYFFQTLYSQDISFRAIGCNSSFNIIPEIRNWFKNVTNLENKSQGKILLLELEES